MKTKLLNQENGQRTFAVVFEQDDEMMAGLQSFAEQQQLFGTHFTAIGAFSRVTLGYFQRQTLDYKEIPVEEQVEVLSLIGNIARKDGGYKVHAHGVLGKSDGSTAGGHIRKANVWPTLEVVLVEEPAYLNRTVDESTGLALIDLDASKERQRNA